MRDIITFSTFVCSQRRGDFCDCWHCLNNPAILYLSYDFNNLHVSLYIILPTNLFLYNIINWINGLKTTLIVATSRVLQWCIHETSCANIRNATNRNTMEKSSIAIDRGVSVTIFCEPVYILYVYNGNVVAANIYNAILCDFCDGKYCQKWTKDGQIQKCPVFTN